MKDPDHEPIIQAQDFPKSEFKASTATIKGDTAKVTITGRDASYAHPFPVTLVKNRRRLAHLRDWHMEGEAMNSTCRSSRSLRWDVAHQPSNQRASIDTVLLDR
jgi:hypothetical protein